MSRTSEHHVVSGVPRPEAGTAGASQGLEWLWRHLQGVLQPRILDCGPISQATLEVLIRRGAKFYAADMITPALEDDPRFWDRTRKSPLFLTADFLDQLPKVSDGSLTAVLSWNLLDFIPRDSLPVVMERLFSLLEPLGVLFSILREPHVTTGVERRWWLESLATPHSEVDSQKTFRYPPITNREVERLLPRASIKTFLTRAGRREVLALRPAEGDS